MNLSSVVFEEFQALALTVVCLVGTLWFNVRLALKATWCQGQAAEGSENLLNSGTKVRQYLTKKLQNSGPDLGPKVGPVLVPEWGPFLAPPILKLIRGPVLSQKRGPLFGWFVGSISGPPELTLFCSECHHKC